jgi:hypothetical protein
METYLPSDLLSYLKITPMALISHPIGVESSKVASVLVEHTRLPDRTGLIVTFNASSTKESLQIADSKHIAITDYSDYEGIMSKSNIIICFDNLMQAVDLFGMDNIRTLAYQHNVLFFLYTYGIKEHYFFQMQTKFPELTMYMWKATFADRGEKMSVNMHQVKMTPRQDLRYAVEYEKEKEEFLDYTVSTYNQTQRCCNIVYPLPIQGQIDTDKTISISSLIDEYTYPVLLQDAPKIRELFIVLALGIDQRHVVYTKFDDEYGIIILESIARYFKYNVIVVKNTFTPEDKNKIIESINVDPTQPCVIIVNTMFDQVIPKNISQLHFFDGDIKLMEPFIKTLYKYSLYTIPPALSINFYVANRSNNVVSIEGILYTQLRELIIHYNDLWDKVKTQSSSIVTNQSRLGIAI